VRVARELRLRPFRGSVAVAAGLLTSGQLRGPQFTRLFPDVYIAADVALDHRLWCQAALIYAGPAGTISGLSAARLWGAPLGNDGDPVEVTIPTSQRTRFTSPRLRIVRARSGAARVMTSGSLAVTDPVETVFGLSNRRLRADAVIAVESFLDRNLTTQDSLDAVNARHAGTRAGQRFGEVLSLAEPRSESPMETRTRLVMIDGGLPPPTVQFEVFDAKGRFVARLDLAYEEWKIGIEYEGDHHRERATFRRDIARGNKLADLGWAILRLTADDVLRNPDEMVRRIRKMISAAQRP
jgi:Protein of unknown function (DUF559)